jgi:hypothetical protein
VQQDGWFQSGPVGGEYTETFESGGSSVANDFFNYQKATKSGTKYEDMNANGAFDEGELGLSGWTIYIDANGNNIFDAGETSAVTDGDGKYSFSLDPGTYTFREVQQDGWFQSGPVGGEYTETFESGGSSVANDFFNYQKATKSGVKYNDLNGNGTRDEGEPGLEGWTIYIDANLNNIFEGGETFAITDSNGNYSFSLDPGTYTFQEVNQPGWVQTEGGYTETLTSGEISSNNNFGNWQPICALTPGFWSQHLWAWDGNSSTDGQVDQQGRTLASKLVNDKVLSFEDVLISVDSNRNGAIDGSDIKGVLLGDINKNGLWDDTANVFFKLQDAQNLISSSTNLANRDQRSKLARTAIASQLNLQNDAAADVSVKDLITGAALWLSAGSPYNSFTGKNSGITGDVDTLAQPGEPLALGWADAQYTSQGVFNGFAGPAVSASMAAWQQSMLYQGESLSASAIHGLLDNFNNCYIAAGIASSTTQTLLTV